MPLLRFTLQRLAGMLVLLLAISAITFFLVASLPGDPIRGAIVIVVNALTDIAYAVVDPRVAL